MKILYIYRHPDMGFSIGKVFRPIENEMKKFAEVDSIYLPVSNYSFKGMWKNIRYAQRYCKKKKYDIVHITGTEHYLIPFLRKQNIIVTVHDLASFRIHNPIKDFIKNILFVRVLRLANLITCISDKTQNEVLNAINTLDKKVITIYNPIDPLFKLKDKTFNEKNPTILHLGTKPNKNLENTIKTLAGMKCHLRVIGKLTNAQKESLLYSNIVYSNDWNLSDEEIIKEYENCDIVNFPSFYEGFGMPIIEGQSVGRVVLTSNLSPMKEIAGDSAVLVDPYDINSIRSGYHEAFTNYDIYVRKGVENAKLFQLGKIVQQYFDCYKSIL